MLHLNLFGHLSVANCDGHLPGPSVEIPGRPGSLLAFLALARGRFFARSELLAALWPEQSDGGSVRSLNTALWRLRKALARPPLEQDAVVVCDRRGALGVPQEAQLRLDVDEFSRLVGPALDKPLEQLDAPLVEQLRRGVALYHDDILAGFIDDWALRARELHRRTLLNALGRLMQLCTLAQDYAGAIRHAQAILDRDTLREDVHRELMQLFLLNGQRAMALQQFEQCRHALRKELAIEPMRETLAVYQRISDSAVGRVQEPVAPLRVREVENELSLRELVGRAHFYAAQADARLQRDER
ncbi:response regulator receiver protein [Ramlibacter sp. G-1-2-2]|uniref:Response regulator receiver protein n=1 Tax=Ramlibacter agri TaxID=2728837 RepID=A0A848H3R8_9BURK|nr:BTAD domain-containing putative transcriptional regulator [Ramlibacter agri]NML44201.1 response regulator receiver protein [Ramlibacter agri]